MTLPVSGQISLGQVITELNVQPGTISLGQSNVRNLAEKTSGQISMSDLRGNSNGGSSGTYTSGGPYVNGGVQLYGYSASIWGTGGSREGPPQPIGTGGHTIIAIVSDGGSNFSLNVTPYTEPVGLAGRSCNILDGFGNLMVSIPFSSMSFGYEFGYIIQQAGMPVLSPPGTKYTCVIT